MQIYKCGGAVRDTLLGLPPSDTDYCVVGATTDEMLNLGFIPIDATSFPVFLHPETRDEYALARTEKKIGPGYHGFDINSDPSVTLEDDLWRRDLTINAIAVDDKGVLFDPCNGVDDINGKILRHTSVHFAEDPVRALRCARFMARWGDSWTVHESTVALIKDMHSRHEFSSLTRERVWKELSRAVMEPHAPLFFKCLIDWGIFDAVFGGVTTGWTTEQSFLNTDFMVLRELIAKDASLTARLAACGLSVEDLTNIKADRNIIRFVDAIRPALGIIEAEDNLSSDIVNAFCAVNLYQNEHRHKDFFDVVSAVIGPIPSAVLQEFFECSRNISFNNLSTAQKQSDKKNYSNMINELRAEAIDDYISNPTRSLA